ncbi:MAG: transglutaminase-like domain-containing protein [Acidobacteriia bacterium]|nr:transglutaminase-like domain-containing protein [Terriglobia bacterium]
MRWLEALVGSALLCTVSASADEALIVLPTALAARVETGWRSTASIGLEGRPGGALATISQTVQALSAEPAFPLASLGGCGDQTAVEVPPTFSLPAGLTALADRPSSAVGVVERVVVFVTQKVRLDENDTGPQDSASVLERGRGRCSGRANLAVGLLRRLGIPARVVQGLLIGEDSVRWHRWGEAWLGPLGWLPFDPGASVGLVGVRYLPLRGSGEGSSLAGVRLERLDERGYLGVPVRNGLRVLPTGGVTLRCVAPAHQANVTALLLGPDGSRWARHGRGGVVFTGMLPGRYRIVWRGDGPSSVLDLVLGAVPDVLVELGTPVEAGT